MFRMQRTDDFAKNTLNFSPFHAWCRCTFEIVVDDWDQWMDAYVKKHATNGNHLKDIFSNGTIGSNKTVISKDVMQNIKSFDLPELTAKENEELRQAMVKLLEKVDGTAQNTECAYYYDMHMKFLKWEMGSSGSGTVGCYKPLYDYITLHNHPSGGTFSIEDIRTFAFDNKMKYLIAIGNNGNQYVISKTSNFNSVYLMQDYYEYMVSLLKQDLQIELALSKCSDFLKGGAKKYGYKYKKITK